MRGVFTPDPACASSLSPASQSFGSAGGTGSVAVTSPAGCNWTAAIPSNASLGDYFLLVCADDTTDVTETNEANNCKASTTRVAVGP